MKQFFLYGPNYTRPDVLADWLEKREPFKNSTGNFQGIPNPDSIELGRLIWEREDSDQLVNAHKAGLVDYVVYSYETPIVWHVKGVGWVDPRHGYTQTTKAKHYHPARMAIGYLENDN